MAVQFNESKKVRLPESFRPFFWSYDFEKLDPDNNKKTIIIQVINYGDMKQWAWLLRYYGLDVIKEILSTLPINEIKPRTRELTSLIFSVNYQSHVSRGTYR